MPVGSRNFDGEPGGIARAEHELPGADARPVPLALWPEEPPGREREGRGAARRDLPGRGEAGRLDVAVPEHLARDERHSEAAGPQRPLSGLGFQVVALDRGAAGPVVVEVLRVVLVVVGPEVADRAHAEQETVRELEIELRPNFEPTPLDRRSEMEVIDQVVARERVPPESELRPVGRGLEVSLLTGRRSRRKKKDHCRSEGLTGALRCPHVLLLTSHGFRR